MPENQKPSYRRIRQRRPAQQFDIIAPAAKPPKKVAPSPGSKPRQTAAFPAVGMTLNGYVNQQSGAPSSAMKQPIATPNRFARLRGRIPIKRILLVLLALLVLVGGWLGWKFVYNAHRLFGGSVFSALSTSKLAGESTGRVNILLAGNSADDPGHQGGTLTDSIMVMSVDTKNHTAFMLSIPRDLYVSIPGNGHQKINSVYPIGEKSNFSQSGYADGGMGLLQKTIKEDLGITTNYYALVNYNALRDAVNSVGGVDITIASSDKRGLYDPSKDYTTGGVLVKLTNGTHHLNGQQALDLARARGDARGSYGFANSDFDRTEHQRQLILALRSKATSAGVLTNPIKLGSLFDSIGGNVDTDIKLGNVRRLYEVTKGISGASIQSIGLNDADGQNLLKNYRTSRGESALIPEAGLDDYSDIQKYVQRITSTDPIVRENASLVLLNGTTTSGLAAHESYILGQKNISVAMVADADREDYATTQIIDLSGGKKPGTIKALQKIYTSATVTTTNPFGTKYKADIIVVVGADKVKANAAADQ